MRPLLAFLAFLATPALAQITLSLTGPAATARGSTVTLSLALSGSTANGPTALQWTAAPPDSLTFTAPGPGSVTKVATKGISCNPANTLCVAWGMNTNVIAAGQVATLAVQIPGNATLGPLTFPLTGLVAVDKNGAPMTVTSGPVFTLTIQPDKRDLTGDGIIDVSDAQAAVTQIFGTCGTADIIAPTGCDALDLVQIVLKALGQIP